MVINQCENFEILSFPPKRFGKPPETPEHHRKMENERANQLAFRFPAKRLDVWLTQR